MRIIIIAGLLVYLLGTGACIKSSIIGDDILKSDEIFIDFSDEISMSATTLVSDSVEVFPNLRNNHLLGMLDNDIFGITTASLAVDFTASSGLADTIDPGNLKIDSMILTIVLDTTYYFGDNNATHNIVVYELQENIRINVDDPVKFHSNYNFDHSSTPIGQLSFIPSEQDTIRVIEPKNDTSTYNNILRVQLDNSLAQKFLADTSIFSSTIAFKTAFKGLYLASTTNAGSIVGVSKINFNNTVSTKIELYYSVEDELSKLVFPISNVVPIFENDYSGAEVDQYFDNTELGDEFVYFQGLTGTKVRLTISGLDTLSDKNINHAEIVLYSYDHQENDHIPNRLIAFVEDEDGKLTELEDFLFSDAFGNVRFYDGFSYDYDENGEKGKKYRIGITTHIRELIKNKKDSTKLMIFPSDRILNPGSVKLYGPRNGSLKTKLNVVFSEKE